jgi:hypothetical protein
MTNTRYQCWLQWAGLKEEHGFSTIEICRHYETTYALWLQARLIEWQKDVAPDYPTTHGRHAYEWLACDRDYKGEKSFDSWLARWVKSNHARIVLTRKIADAITQDLRKPARTVLDECFRVKNAAETVAK